ncbi:MAG: lysine-sensitive aspartokinase 3 [Saprospirales bacterium]|nr:MAG: lysine-sensitive aspartokinase 3 [Saprospirales bacterium]
MENHLKVAKFGGTSMRDLQAMQSCAGIVADDPARKVVIVSATAGTTDQLTELCEAHSLDRKEELLKQIEIRHLELAVQTGPENNAYPGIKEMLIELRSYVHGVNEVTAAERDYILSFGERLSSSLFANVLSKMVDGVVWLDVKDILLTDDFHGKAEPQLEEIANRALKKLKPLLENGLVVSQGFIGSTLDGKTTTLGRGGSDYSAALFAEALSADILEIWTDVAGIFSTDPGIVPDAHPIEELNFNEAAELAIYGAKVLHPATLKTAIRKNTRVFVGKSMDPQAGGTWISQKTGSAPNIRGISIRRNQKLITIHSLDMVHQFGFLARIFEVLARHKTSVDLVSTSEVNVSLTLDTGIQSNYSNRMLDNAIEELRTFSTVHIESDLSLVAVIGNKLNQTPGISGKIFNSLRDINIRMVCHGASPHNLCFLVNDRDGDRSIRLIHKQFLTQPKKEEVL